MFKMNKNRIVTIETQDVHAVNRLLTSELSTYLWKFFWDFLTSTKRYIFIGNFWIFWYSPKTQQKPANCWCAGFWCVLVLISAEREGFEPPDLLQSTVFKTVAIDHSAISLNDLPNANHGAKVQLLSISARNFWIFYCKNCKWFIQNGQQDRVVKRRSETKKP